LALLTVRASSPPALSLLAGILALAGLSLASPKTYSVSFTHSAKAGAQLTAGECTLKIDGSNAVFTSVQTSKSVTIPVKVENGQKKFRVTSVDSTTEGPGERIHSIQLGGSTTTLDFAY
jgi:hypothetical protein